MSAGSEVEALVLDDSLILELLVSEPSFAQWCGSHLFTAELAALLALLLEQHPQAGTSFQELLDQARPQARLVPPEPAALAALPIDFSLLAASHNLIDHPLGAALNPSQGVPAATPPLPPRLIALPAELLAPVAPVLEAELMPEGSGSHGQPGGSNPPLASALDLGQRDRTALQLLRGNGPLEETLACFQMLAAELKLPFRRDAIEKILRDVLRRGQTQDLQLCGNLAAMMGLHVSGVRVPANQGTRLQTPALIPWQGGFAVVRAANALGLLLASPRQGWVEIFPDQLPEAFPDGIEVLLLERSSATP